MTTALFKSFAAAATILIGTLSASAQTYVQQLGYDAPDGNRITGFIYQSAKTKEDAPLAVLMHGLMGSSLYWLAEDNMMYGDDVSAMLIERGYRVLALDARRHGARRNGDKPMALVKAARKGNSEAYQNMINNSVKDYQYLLDKMLKSFKGTKKVVVMGYSMGAQMGTLLAAQDERVTHLVTMVPPAVRNVPEVSPINFAADVKAPWLLITAEDDEYSSDKQNAELVAAGKTITNKSFDSGHVLPQAYVKTIETWLNTQQ